jgi:hypothetical protein
MTGSLGRMFRAPEVRGISPIDLTQFAQSRRIRLPERESMSDDKPEEGLFEGYGEGDDVPLFSYAVLVGVFNLIFVLFLLLARISGRPIPERVKLGDIVLFGVATHKLSWIISRDAITAPLRAPFTELEEVKNPTNIQEKPRDTGLQRSVGELLTCRFCLGMWISAFFAYGLVLFPAATRLVGAIFAMLTLSDHLHQIYKALMNRA